jgi:hypothetical protein
MEEFAAIISAIGLIATPIFLAFLAAIGWTFRQSYESSQANEKYLRELEDKLREDRIAIYQAILEPFILAFTKVEGLGNDRQYKGKQPSEVANEIMTSLKYKQTAFRLALMGSDAVVKAFNELMQYVYNDMQTNSSDPKPLMKLLGNLLIEIRKSVGNEKTKIDNLEILEWLIKDVRKFRD